MILYVIITGSLSAKFLRVTCSLLISNPHLPPSSSSLRSRACFLLQDGTDKLWVWRGCKSSKHTVAGCMGAARILAKRRLGERPAIIEVRVPCCAIGDARCSNHDSQHSRAVYTAFFVVSWRHQQRYFICEESSFVIVSSRVEFSGNIVLKLFHNF